MQSNYQNKVNPSITLYAKVIHSRLNNNYILEQNSRIHNIDILTYLHLKDFIKLIPSEYIPIK